MEKIMKKWLDCWIYVIIMVAGVVLDFLISDWKEVDMGTKLFSFATILLPVHVLEEWHFPGGFHTMYNTMSFQCHLDKHFVC